MTGSKRDTAALPNPLQEYISAKEVAHKRLVRRPFLANAAQLHHSSSSSSSGKMISSTNATHDHRFSMSMTSLGSPSSASSTTNSPRSRTPSSGSQDHPDLILKVVLIGDSGVGKSNLVLRFAKNKFVPQTKSTVGFEFATKSIRVGERRFKAQVWDTAGQDRFQSLTAAYYRNAVGAMVVYDVTNRQSFENVSKWLAQVHEHSHENLVMVLVGNKCDLSHVPHTRQVSTLEAARFAATHGMEFVETSALDATNVMDAFKKIIVPVGRLLSPSDDAAAAHNIARLPTGWRRVLSRTRPGEYSYENQYTRERIAFAPKEPAKPSQQSFRVGSTGSLASPSSVTVTRESLQLQHQKAALLAQSPSPPCGACNPCSIM